MTHLMIFATDSIPKRAARDVEKLLADVLPASGKQKFPHKDLTAYVLCGASASWHDLVNVSDSPKAASPLDEECGPEVFRARREEQVQRAIEFFAKQGVPLERGAAATLLRNWQPSASRPQLDVARFYEVQANNGYTGSERVCTVLLNRLIYSREVPNAQQVELILDNVYFSRDPRRAAVIQTDAGIVAVRLVNLREHPDAAIGVRILEAFEGSGFDYPRVSLAKALTYGWGCEPAPKRAWALLRSVDIETFTTDAAKIEYCKLVAGLAAGGEVGARNLPLALKMCERAAHLGDGESAYNACLFYAKTRFDAKADIYSGVVEPDEERSLAYFHMAIIAGYKPNTAQFAPGA